MNTNIKKNYMFYMLYLISICNSVQEIQELTSDKNSLRKYSVDFEKPSDDNLFNTTLKFLERLCVCLNETLNKSDSTVFKDNSHIQNVLESDVYQNNNNNTCLDIQDNVVRKINEIKDADNGKANNNDLLEVKTNGNNTEFEDVLFTSFIKTQNFHTYVINEYSIAKKASALDVQDHSTIVILTIYDSLVKSNSLTNRNVTKLELYNLLFKNNTKLYIDIISAKSNIKSFEKIEQNKPYKAQLCNLYSIYTTLIKSKNNKNLKNYKILQRNGFMKIYIEVIKVKDQDKLTKLCCKDNNSMEICKKPLGTEIKNIGNFVSQKKETTKMYRSIIRRIKNLIKRYFGKFHNENECNVLAGDIRNSDVIDKNKTHSLYLIESSTITDKGYFATNNKFIYPKRKPEKKNRSKSVFTSINHILNNKRIIPLMQAPSHQNNVRKVMNFYQSNSDVEKDSGKPHINKTILKISTTIDIKDVTNNIVYSSAVTEVMSTTESQSSESKDIEFDTVVNSMFEEPTKKSIEKVNVDHRLSTTLSDLFTTLNNFSANTTNFNSNVNNLLKTNEVYVTTGNHFDYIHQVIDKKTTSGFEAITSSNLYLQSTKRPTTSTNLRGVSKETVSSQYIKHYAQKNNSAEPNINKTTQKIPKIADIKVVNNHNLYSTVLTELTSASDSLLLESEDIEFETILNSLSEKAKVSNENFDNNISVVDRLLTTQEILSTTNNFDDMQHMEDKKLKTSFNQINTLPNKLYLQSTERLTTSASVRNDSKENLSSKYIKAYTKENLRENFIYTNNKNEDILQFKINTISKPEPYILKYQNQVIEPNNETIVDQTFENVGLTIKTDKTLRFSPNFDISTTARYTENVFNTFGQLEISLNMTEASIKKNTFQQISLLPLTKNPIMYTEKTVFLKNNSKKFKHTTASTTNGTISKNTAPKVNEESSSYYVIYKTKIPQYTQNSNLNSSTNFFEKSTDGIIISNNDDLSFTIQPINVTSTTSERVGLQKENRLRNAAPAVTSSVEEPPIITQTYVEISPFIDIVENLNEEKEVLQRNEQESNKSHCKNSNFGKSMQKSEMGNTDITKSKPNYQISSQYFNLKDTMLALNKEKNVFNTLTPLNSSKHNDEDNKAESVFLKDNNFILPSNFKLPPFRNRLTNTNKPIYNTTKPAKYETNSWPNKFITGPVILDKLTVFNDVFKGKGKFRQSYTAEVKDWWLDDMYLKVRLPLPINSNPGMVFPRRHFAKMDEVADLAALYIDDLLDYKEMLERGELPQERATSREKGQPLCMEQFYNLLGVCRIPEVGKDRLEFPQPPNENVDSEELVIVACRNYFYPIPIKATDRGRLTAGEMQAQLLHVLVDAAGAPPAPRIGLLTSMNRDQWAMAREQIIRDENNRDNLELISRALCLVCLDEAGGDRSDADSDTNALLRAMHGGGTRYHSANRWFDKTVQLIISSDGTVGMCYEHSPAEGVAVIRLAERALSRAQVSDRPTPPPVLLPAPQAMKWNLTPDLMKTIDTAAREIDRHISDLDLKVYTYRGYGRDYMKSCRISPDVYIQLALQYAYYKMYGHLVSTYESASLRRFRGGRVDNIRAAHGAALAWAAAMCAADTPPAPPAEDDSQKKVSFNLYGEQKKLELFQEAARKQTAIMEANILGRGMDNHLLGLREAAREEHGELPALFTDSTYEQMIHFKLSTSQVATTVDGTFMGYGAVVPDGYGCAYNPKKDSVIFCISSFTSSNVTNTEAFKQFLEKALDSMKLMFQNRKV